MRRIVVAEDDTEMRRLVAEALRKDGHHVLEVADGAGLLDVLTRVTGADSTDQAFDLVVSDDRMPVRGGLDVLEQLATAQLRPPFIVMTAFANEDTRRRTERLGGKLLEKPLMLSALREAVAGLLSDGHCA
jgi:two-component system, cell cycle response regulator CpdR